MADEDPLDAYMVEVDKQAALDSSKKRKSMVLGGSNKKIKKESQKINAVVRLEQGMYTVATSPSLSPLDRYRLTLGSRPTDQLIYLTSHRIEHINNKQ